MSNDLTTFYCFVYGTLKSGYANFEYYAEPFLIAAPIPARVFDHTLYGHHDGIAYAAPVKRAGKARAQIVGELLTLVDDALPELDRLEGHPFSYQRVAVSVLPLHGGAAVKAWMYVNPRAALHSVEIGAEWRPNNPTCTECGRRGHTAETHWNSSTAAAF